MLEFGLTNYHRCKGHNYLIYVVFAICFVTFSKCKSPDTPVKPHQPVSANTLFESLSPERTGITFSNTLIEGLNTNVMIYEYFYNGGGVAIGDLNGDGLQDIYFTGNMTDNVLYLNKGHMQFKDVTSIAGVAGRPGPWKTGVTFVDINGDGRLDIYVCYSGRLGPEKRVNQLFINQGNDRNGIPVFKEMSADYGLNFPSYSTQAYFFDYDRDGDLDLLLVNHNPQRISSLDKPTVKALMNKTDKESGIRLFKNNHGHFAEVTEQAGIINSPLSYGLAAGIADINNDGWPDIYISNDYYVPDRLYINDGKGKFSDELSKQFGHTSLNSMGNDIADINNDLHPDIYTLDMLPADNKRQKILFGDDNFESFNLNLSEGFFYQYMRNMLHLSNGNNTFSEIGQLSGISNTDWSWAPLLADYDNDGWKDLFVSNGFTRDYTDKDFLKLVGENLGNRRIMRQDILDLVNQMPSSQVESYFFRNNTDLTFSDMSADWGITEPSDSNGAAYADLDNDGDLDLVVNNINRPAFIYENHASVQNKNHFLAIKLKGTAANTQGIGTKVIIYSGTKKQYLEQMPARGYQSSVSPVLHFGLGTASRIDSLRVIWQRGKTELMKNVMSDQQITLNEKNAISTYQYPKPARSYFKEVKSPVNFHASVSVVNDFKRQALMVNPMSFPGPCLAKGDVNGDGLEDVYVGGSGKQSGLYIQQKDGSFVLKFEAALIRDKNCTDAAAVFFDANNDGKLDLYVCSGGYGDYQPDDPLLQDRLYLNDGNGNFLKSSNALPKMLSSKSCIKVADINGDGSPDLFVGGRVIPGKYPMAPQSFLLINDKKGHFTDETSKYNTSLKNIGMVTDAAWVDMNGDGRSDLVVVGEWMPITVFENTGKRLVEETGKYFDKKYTGWWNCLQVSDINHDGHPDLVAGNMGLNTQCKVSDAEPAEIYYKDFDGNGSIDPILCFYIQHKSYPYITRDELIGQITMMGTRFPDYKNYADATINQLFTAEELKDAGHLTANCLSTACFLSDNHGRLKQISLPVQVQYSPVFTITSLDYNHDGKADLLFCGNITHSRVRFGKYDANYGVLLKGDGKGNYKYIPQQQSGFKLFGDVRSTVKLNNMILFGISEKGIVAYKE